MRNTRLDVRQLKRAGVLDGAADVPGAFTSRTTLGELLLVVRIAGGLAVSLDDRVERIGLTNTPQHLGGRRPWFLCPSCRRRAAILYGAPFACRRCLGWPYPSQREGPLDRANRRCRGLRERLGGSDVLADPLPDRPTRMHHSTYSRLAAQYAAAEQARLRRFAIATSWIERRRQ